MSERAVAGTWVEVHRDVLAADERAPQVPIDTGRVPLEMKVRGFLVRDAALGEEAEICTRAGRRLRGTLTALNPAYTHSFGSTVPELSGVGDELRSLLLSWRKGEP